MQLQGRTVLITGGTSGIGLEMARQLLARRNTVIITGRNLQRLAETQAELPHVHTIQSDASRPEDIEALLRRVEAEYPDCDTLINNAGIMRNLNLNGERSLPDATRELDINLSGPIWMTQAFLPHLRSKPNALIVNITSGLAYVPFPLSPVYSAAKAGLHAFTRCLRVQLKGSGVTVVELAPPLVETNLLGDDFAGVEQAKGMAADVLVRKAIAGMEAGTMEVRPGLSGVLYFLSRAMPSLPFGQMAKMVRPVN